MTNHFDRNKKQLSERNQTLQKIKKVLDNLKITFFLEGGVLLGAVRNKNFIKWDHDVEIGVFSEKLNKQKILNILHNLQYQDLIIDYVDSSNDNFKINLHEHDHSKFSIIGFKKEKKFIARHMYKYPSNFFSRLDDINFLGRNYKIPNNVKDFLKWTYGDWEKEVRSRNIEEYMSNVLNSRFNRFLKKIESRIKFFFNKKIYQIKSHHIFMQREHLFQCMMNSNKKKNIIFFDIGSNDGIESVNFLKNNPYAKSIIVEPDKRNIKTIKKNLFKNYIKKKQYIIINAAVSNKNFKGFFYLNNKFSNLNSSVYNAKSKKIQVEYKILKNILKNYSNNNIMIKMDLEGDELNVLKGAVEYLCKAKNISIVLELHPIKYKKNEMIKIFKKLFKNGYKVKFAETAYGVKLCEFSKNSLTPIETFRGRKLYSNLDKKIILEYALKPHFKLTKFNPGFRNKIFRSLMIEKIDEK